MNSSPRPSDNSAGGPPTSPPPAIPLPPGPPAGPLSGGGTRPPDPEDANGTGHGEPGGRSRRRRGTPTPRTALITTAVVAALALALGLVLTHPTGAPQQRGEVFLQAAGATGPDPFTEPVVQEDAAPAAPAAGTVTRSVNGDAPGLYGGTRQAARCNVNRQITTLGAHAPKNRAFASTLGLKPSRVPSYLRTLTPLKLTTDTLVTNHGYRNGRATSYPAVLQAGTSVLVDRHGTPRVRCACGNPLTPPAPRQAPPRDTHNAWPGYRPSDVITVTPTPRPVQTFVTTSPTQEDHPTRRAHPHDPTTSPPPEHQPPAPETTTSRPKDKTAKDASSPGPGQPPTSSPAAPPANPDPAPADPAPAPADPAPADPAPADPPSPPEPEPAAPEKAAPDDATSAPPASRPQQPAAPGSPPAP
ncbi:DUF6777 domain-containing protein [Streptomyces luteolifulvus]|uniref:DUF6777 domain-containing protein n=1 Tax=Streptomyces luteolifulvus TaxID=2615112 RepID=UPI001785C4DD|nr:DUF6777 domain-containing protein [Streptomyces luteolifulvus]